MVSQVRVNVEAFILLYMITSNPILFNLLDVDGLYE